MLRRAAFILLLGSATTQAFAQPAIPLPPSALAAPAADPSLPRPLVAPPADWVLPADIPPAPPQAGEAAIVLLLSDQQARLEADRANRYYAFASRIGSAQALQAASLALEWDPALETLTIHRFRLIRDGKPIDLLKDGSPLVVVRREPNLEQAAIDGRLTATLQPDDVRVGDIVDLAFTISRSDPAAPGRAEHTAIIPFRMPIGRARIRILAPEDMPISHRVFPGMVEPRRSKARGQQELLIDLKNHVAPEPPRGAPMRYFVVNGIEATNAQGWADIARTFAPQYDKAATLVPDSPLKAEAARIRAASNDPKVQASLALALVQDQVRYLFLGLDGGGYRPTPADETWKRRLGDCKAKSVLLTALLRELGIEARPALVSTAAGDVLPASLPRASAFDHVIVEAQIGGRSYWLDGTQAGETNLERLRPPPFQWALPLTDTADALVAIPAVVLTAPDLRQRLDLDARKGLLVPAEADAELRFRGPVASAWRLALKQMTPADRQKVMQDMWKREYRFITPETVSDREDAATGEQILSMKGKARMDWGNEEPSWYEADGAIVGFRIDTRREPGPFIDAPFAFGHPEWIERSQTILLPNGGKGFRLDGKDFDRSVGIHAFARKADLSGERFHFTASMRSLASEMDAAKARTAEADYAVLAKDNLHIGAPANYVPNKADAGALKAETPTTVEALLRRGMFYEMAGELNLSIADGEAALALAPERADVMGKLAAWLYSTSPERAGKLADEAVKIDPGQWNALFVRGQLLMRQGRFADADREFALALKAAPNFRAALDGRIRALRQLGRDDEAIALLRSKADSDEMKEAVEKLETAIKAPVSREEARTELDSRIAADPGNPQLLRARAHMRNRSGDKTGALADFEAAIAAAPSREIKAGLLMEMAQARPPMSRAAWRADLDKARQMDPAIAPQVELARGVMEQRYGDIPAAVRALDEAVRLAPDDPDLALMRIERLQQMKRLSPEQAVDTMEQLARTHVDNAQLWNNLCWEKGTRNIRPESALADCDRALQLSPDAPAYRDSRGLVLLRLGRLKEAVAEYDAVLARVPTLAPSLYARGLAKSGLGDRAGATADFAVARDKDKDIDKMFADFGLAAPDAPPAAAPEPQWKKIAPIPGGQRAPEVTERPRRPKR